MPDGNNLQKVGVKMGSKAEVVMCNNKGEKERCLRIQRKITVAATTKPDVKETSHAKLDCDTGYG